MLCMSKVSKIDQIHLRAVMLCLSKMSKIHQIHVRAVMLCMSKVSKMGKEHTDTFWLITSLIINGFSIRKKFWKAETESFPTIHQILCMLKHVEDVKDLKYSKKKTLAHWSIPGSNFFHFHTISSKMLSNDRFWP